MADAAGVTVAEVNLKLIWDVVSQIKVGKDGYAYVVDRQGRLVAHPDISLVLRGTDMSRLPQVAAALRQAPADDTRPVDATTAPASPCCPPTPTIPALSWLVFVELPTQEAQQPVDRRRPARAGLLVLGLLIAGLAGALLARRMVVPIRALQAGAAAHRQRRARPSPVDQDRRRARGAGQPVQPHRPARSRNPTPRSSSGSRTAPASSPSRSSSRPRPPRSCASSRSRRPTSSRC